MLNMEYITCPYSGQRYRPFSDYATSWPLLVATMKPNTCILGFFNATGITKTPRPEGLSRNYEIVFRRARLISMVATTMDTFVHVTLVILMNIEMTKLTHFPGHPDRYDQADTEERDRTIHINLFRGQLHRRGGCFYQFVE
jgi:hypothetical protein